MAFEQKHGVKVPADLAGHFRLLDARKREEWKDMYQFFRLGEFNSLTGGLPQFPSGLNSRSIVETLEACEYCYVFADWMINSFAYAIRLYPGPSVINEVYAICGAEFQKIADSFSGFMELIERDDLALQLG